MFFVDSHLHLDLLYKEARPAVEMLLRIGCLPVSWAFSRDVRTCSDLERYLEGRSRFFGKIRKELLHCYYLVGIHPRNIPSDLDSESVHPLLSPLLEDPMCLGIGEIGLETGSEREKEIFRAQLNMAGVAARKGKVIGIHTPRNEKEGVTSMILDILDDYSAWKDSMVVDHCTPQTIGRVLSSGLWAGITVSPPKSSIVDVKKILQEHSSLSGKIMLNTDSGDILYEDLYRISASGNIPGPLKRAVTRDNACRFFGINPEARMPVSV